MRLHCVDHDKRVQVLPSTRVIHRSNGEQCNSERVEIGRFAGTPVQVISMRDEIDEIWFENEMITRDC